MTKIERLERAHRALNTMLFRAIGTGHNKLAYATVRRINKLDDEYKALWK